MNEEEEILQIFENTGAFGNYYLGDYSNIDIAKFIRKILKQNTDLKTKYSKVLTMLANHYPPCELDGFMDKNVEYCSMNCGVDEEVFKECWDRYIEQELEDDRD